MDLCAHRIPLDMYCKQSNLLEYFLERFILDKWSFFYKLMICLFKEMKDEIMEKSDFADIIESAKKVVEDGEVWQRLIQESDAIVIKNSEIKQAEKQTTPQKEMEESESIWKKVMDHRLISFFR